MFLNTHSKHVTDSSTDVPKRAFLTATQPHTLNMWSYKIERIQRLPQELADIVFEFYVVTVPAEQTVDITTAYRPPKQLQTNRASRRVAAERYYSTNTFVIDGFDETSDVPRYWNNASATIRWLRSLPVDHSFMIETLSYPDPFEYMEGFALESNLRWRYDLLMQGLKDSSSIALRDDCLRMGYYIGEVNGKAVTLNGKRGELAEKLAKLLIASSPRDALKALVNGRRNWIEL
ncbi:uncharacterized protein MYCFIDRAFT_178642 [Pseudocercospora fijiensis CIRAD86]|uniref:Uncharacterized protein n=1 Tax=Pseudocercospora fijiensis (strain CIRAD86) TaxID=383855 RepID=M2ZH87_PSEFD|nr:uncharacterized protein MYCFIDRAFT_178642 [Pseudocercospora fijiensis CIRAD86]EME78504.1 hypothetical protein MYCFIDRAFT_178642 [Pseudocercospora fijiensis CIRAD86]